MATVVAASFAYICNLLRNFSFFELHQRNSNDLFDFFF